MTVILFLCSPHLKPSLHMLFKNRKYFQPPIKPHFVKQRFNLTKPTKDNLGGLIS